MNLSASVRGNRSCLIFCSYWRSVTVRCSSYVLQLLRSRTSDLKVYSPALMCEAVAARMAFATRAQGLNHNTKAKHCHVLRKCRLLCLRASKRSDSSCVIFGMCGIFRAILGCARLPSPSSDVAMLRRLSACSLRRQSDTP